MRSAYIWAISVIGFLLLGLFSFFLVIKERINIWVKIDSLNLGTIKIQDVITKGEILTKVNLGLKYQNKNPFDIVIKNLKIKLFYSGKLLAKNDIEKTIELNKNSEDEFIETIDLKLDKTTIDIVTRYSLKQPIDLNYEIKFSLFGVNLSYKGIYSIVPGEGNSGYKLGQYVKIL